MDTQDGRVFIKHLAHFVQTHEKSIANALQTNGNQTRNPSSPQIPPSPSGVPSPSPQSTKSTLSFPYLSFGLQSIKPVKLTLTPHHLFYLLARFEELGILVGPTNVRLESINTDVRPGNYVSFMGVAPTSRGLSDADSIHSVSSVRSVMSTMWSMWSKFASKEESKVERQKAAEKEDIRYLYSAFTKIPCLRLAPDPRTKLVTGYQEFPFDTAVPLFVFKNVSALEICDIDFRQLCAWDRMADHLRSLTIKRGCVEDISDLLVHIVLDDMDRRRRRSAKKQTPVSPTTNWSASQGVNTGSNLTSSPTSPITDIRRTSLGSSFALSVHKADSSEGRSTILYDQQRPDSPMRPPNHRHTTSQIYPRSMTPRLRRYSGSETSSVSSTPRTSIPNMLTVSAGLPGNKWRFLRHLGLPNNNMTIILAAGLVPLASTLHSLDLSNNLFTEIPEGLSTLQNLRALNLANCMISSLHSLQQHSLPSLTVLNLSSNRLTSLAGIENLSKLQKIDLRDNLLAEPVELAHLTGLENMENIFVQRNPFTRGYPDYRVRIFNLFRTQSSHTVDIIIDSAAPSYGEKKILADRRAFPQPVASRAMPEEGSMPPPPPPIASRYLNKDSTGSPNEIAQETNDYDTMQRLRAPRRRVVEMAQQEYGVQEQEVSATKDRHLLSTCDDISTALLNPLKKEGSKGIPKSDSGRSIVLLDDTSINHDSESTAKDHKESVRQLKSDLGQDWLGAFSDNKWNLPNLAEELRYGSATEVKY